MIPCFPIHHTAATLRAWGIWRHAHPHWVAKIVVPTCVRVGALAIPLALPGAAFLPPVPLGGVAFGGPALYGPAYEVGAGFAPRIYPLPYARTNAPVATPKLGQTSNSFNELGLFPASKELGQVATPMLSGDVPHWVPDRDVLPVQTPEPSTWMVMVAALVGCLALRRWMQ